MASAFMNKTREMNMQQMETATIYYSITLPLNQNMSDQGMHSWPHHLSIFNFYCSANTQYLYFVASLVYPLGQGCTEGEFPP